MPKPPPTSPLDYFFDEILFPRMERAFDDFARRVMNPPAPPRIPKQRSTTKRPHKAPPIPKRKDPRPTQRVLTYYDIFECVPTASVEVIAAAHRALVKKYHPDVAGVSGEAKIKIINSAWEVLRDPMKRKEYDRMIRGGK